MTQRYGTTLPTRAWPRAALSAPSRHQRRHRRPLCSCDDGGSNNGCGLAISRGRSGISGPLGIVARHNLEIR